MYTETKSLTTKKLVTISVDDSISDAARIMRENRIRHLPVVDGNDGIVGILSSKDLPNFVEVKNMSVEFFMSTPVIHVSQDLPLKQAVYSMLENKISCLIVCNENKNAVGIITTDDLLWHLMSKLDQESENKMASIFERLFNKDTAGNIAYQFSTAGI